MRAARRTSLRQRQALSARPRAVLDIHPARPPALLLRVVASTTFVSFACGLPRAPGLPARYRILYYLCYAIHCWAQSIKRVRLSSSPAGAAEPSSQQDSRGSASRSILFARRCILALTPIAGSAMGRPPNSSASSPHGHLSVVPSPSLQTLQAVILCIALQFPPNTPKGTSPPERASPTASGSSSTAAPTSTDLTTIAGGTSATGLASGRLATPVCGHSVSLVRSAPIVQC